MVCLSYLPAQQGCVIWQHLFFVIHVYHTFFIHVTIKGHLDLFRVFTIVNNAAMNMEYRQLYEMMLYFLIGFYSEERLLDNTVVLSLISSGTPHTVFHLWMALPNYLPANSRVSLHLHTLDSICCFPLGVFYYYCNSHATRAWDNVWYWF